MVKEADAVSNKNTWRQVKVMCFESTDDIVRHLEGDETVEPKEEVTISGGDGEAQS